MGIQRRALCEVCGHTYAWHDREAARGTGASADLERPCYREVGGAVCRCGGFRDSGEVATPSGAAFASTARRAFIAALLVLLLVVMVLGLLYAYRAQTPAVRDVSPNQAVSER